MFVTELKFQGKSGFRLFPSRNTHAQDTRSFCNIPDRHSLLSLPAPPACNPQAGQGREDREGGGNASCGPGKCPLGSTLLRAARLRADGAVCRGGFQYEVIAHKEEAATFGKVHWQSGVFAQNQERV